MRKNPASPGENEPRVSTNGSSATIGRRSVLAVGLAAVGTLAVSACVSSKNGALVINDQSIANGGSTPSAAHTPSAAPVVIETPTPTPTPTSIAPALPARIALPAGELYALPIEGDYMAWTVDDGSDSEVIRRYAEFSRDTGTRIVFFVNGCYPGWAENAALLAPLIASGQVQIGNHTFNHAALTDLSDQGIIDELTANEDFIQQTFGVSAKPYYRPPYGYTDARTEAVAASIGYTSPVLWYGSLSDSGPLDSPQIAEFAKQYFAPGAIIIGHANFLPVTEVFPRLERILTKRGIQTVTLDDVFEVAGRPPASQ